eukprot:TRINITY_DN13304_c0_g1_i1.p1 TRINITY_DN13304_c0_g1~~TRINITY_DN13304_c0_g1_i1.p1  ORF type:complete len:341 (-),score=124.87 TRINITY_DN13304_c0_g1_i1:38-1060(-)
MNRAGAFLLKSLVPRTQPIARMMGRWNNRSVAPYMREINRRKKVVELNHMLKDGKVPIPRRSSFTDWNYQAELAALQARIGEKFNKVLLARCFVMESHVQLEIKKQEELGVEVTTGLVDNSELAKEGMEVIDKALGRWLRGALPVLPEEGIVAVINYLTSETMMADIAFHLGLRELVLAEEYPPSARSLCSTLQALVGALASTDSARADEFVTDIIATQIAGKDINEIWLVSDPMRILTNILASSGLPPPESRLLWQTGPATILSNHMVGVFCNKEIVGQSSGETMEIAEEMAARDALRNIFNTAEASTPLPFGHPASGSDKPNKVLAEFTVEAQNIINC